MLPPSAAPAPPPTAAPSRPPVRPPIALPAAVPAPPPRAPPMIAPVRSRRFDVTAPPAPPPMAPPITGPCCHRAHRRPLRRLPAERAAKRVVHVTCHGRQCSRAGQSGDDEAGRFSSTFPYSSLFAIWLLKVRSVRRSESIDVVSGIVPNRGPIHFNELAAKNSTGPHPCRGHSGNKLFTNQRVRTAAPECPQTHASIGFAEVRPCGTTGRPSTASHVCDTWQHIGNGSWAAPETAVGKK